MEGKMMKLKFGILCLCSGLLCCMSFPASAADGPKLVTNIERPKAQTIMQPDWPISNIYDLSFVAYDAAFAEEFGLKEVHVTNMDDHLRFMEVRMITEGAQTSCYYNLILDKSVKLDFPEENYYLNTQSPALNMPWAYDGISIEKKKHRHTLMRHPHLKKYKDINRFTNRTYIGNRGYTVHRRGKTIRGGVIGYAAPQYIIQDRDLPYNIFTLMSSCGYGLLEHPEPVLWFRKQGQSDQSPNLEGYHTFEIPPMLVEQLKPYYARYAKFLQRQYELQKEDYLRLKERATQEAIKKQRLQQPTQ